MNATSVLKSQKGLRFFSKSTLIPQKPHKTGGYESLLIQLDGMVRIVLPTPVRRGDNKKRYRFTPSVSKRRMPVAQSVDVLGVFGAKKSSGSHVFRVGRQRSTRSRHSFRHTGAVLAGLASL